MNRNLSRRLTAVLRGGFRASLATLVAGTVAVTGCSSEPEPVAEVARPVRLVEIGFGGASGWREYPGVVAAVQRADMAFEVPGLIVTLPVTEGQEVLRGQLLAQLDARDFEARRDADRARRSAARADYERHVELYAVNAISLQDLELKEREFEVADANLRMSQKAVDDATLRAPFSGRVARTLVDAFQTVQAKEPVLILQDDTGLEIEIDVPEADALVAVRGVSLEQRNQMIDARVTISAFPESDYPARITEFSSLADPVTRTFRVTFGFDQTEDLPVAPGMTASVAARKAEGAILPGIYRVPAIAVFAGADGESSVWKVDPETMTVRKASVTVGTLYDDAVEILAGLEDGDLIAASAVTHLREGMEVRRMADRDAP